MDFVHKFKSELFETDAGNFIAKSLELFQFQYQQNLLYHTYVNSLHCNPENVDSIEKIPFLPISFFKQHKIVSTKQDYPFYFESSGTTSSLRSRLYFYDEDFYLGNATRIFEQMFGSTGQYSFFFLLPNYLERKNSSLVSMANHFFNASYKTYGGFYLHEVERLQQELERALKARQGKVILWGVTFALLDFAERFPGNYEGLIVFETGGMKGRGREPLRSEVHKFLFGQLGPRAVHSEYGMTELFSQAYSLKDEIFETPATLKVLLRELDDPLSVHLRMGERGGINVIDLANVDTCAFIETQDIGVLREKGFEVLGRVDNSEVRGCNLLLL